MTLRARDWRSLTSPDVTASAAERKIVWAKYGRYSFWPARHIGPDEFETLFSGDSKYLRDRHPDCVPVLFFMPKGSSDFAWIRKDRVRPWDSEEAWPWGNVAAWPWRRNDVGSPASGGAGGERGTDAALPAAKPPPHATLPTAASSPQAALPAAPAAETETTSSAAAPSPGTPSSKPPGKRVRPPSEATLKASIAVAESFLLARDAEQTPGEGPAEPGGAAPSLGKRRPDGGDGTPEGSPASKAARKTSGDPSRSSLSAAAAAAEPAAAEPAPSEPAPAVPPIPFPEAVIDVQGTRVLKPSRSVLALLEGRPARDRPPAYRHLTRSSRVPPVTRPRRLPADDIATCACAPGGEGCGPGCLNRLSFLRCDPQSCPAGPNCGNGPFDRVPTTPVEVFLTPECGWGVRATLGAHAGDLIAEYTGEVVTPAEAARRALAARLEGAPHFYAMRAGASVIDAGPAGCVSRLLNSSCDPNCEASKWRDASTGEVRVAIFATRAVRPGEELTYRYNFAAYDGEDGAGLVCRCGAPGCVGSMAGASSAARARPVAARPDPPPAAPPPALASDVPALAADAPGVASGPAALSTTIEPGVPASGETRAPNAPTPPLVAPQVAGADPALQLATAADALPETAPDPDAAPTRGPRASSEPTEVSTRAPGGEGASVLAPVAPALAPTFSPASLAATMCEAVSDAFGAPHATLRLPGSPHRAAPRLPGSPRPPPAPLPPPRTPPPLKACSDARAGPTRLYTGSARALLRGAPGAAVTREARLVPLTVGERSRSAPRATAALAIYPRGRDGPAARRSRHDPAAHETPTGRAPAAEGGAAGFRRGRANVTGDAWRRVPPASRLVPRTAKAGPPTAGASAEPASRPKRARRQKRPFGEEDGEEGRAIEDRPDQPTSPPASQTESAAAGEGTPPPLPARARARHPPGPGPARGTTSPSGSPALPSPASQAAATIASLAGFPGGAGTDGNESGPGTSESGGGAATTTATATPPPPHPSRASGGGGSSRKHAGPRAERAPSAAAVAAAAAGRASPRGSLPTPASTGLPARTILVAKKLTNSDVTKGRILLPRAAVEANLAFATGRAHVLAARDHGGRTWRFMLQSWANGMESRRVYVLEHAGDFIRTHALRVEDVIGLSCAADGEFLVEYNTREVRSAAETQQAARVGHANSAAHAAAQAAARAAQAAAAAAAAAAGESGTPSPTPFAHRHPGIGLGAGGIAVGGIAVGVGVPGACGTVPGVPPPVLPPGHPLSAAADGAGASAAAAAAAFPRANVGRCTRSEHCTKPAGHPGFCQRTPHGGAAAGPGSRGRRRSGVAVAGPAGAQAPALAGGTRPGALAPPSRLATGADASRPRRARRPSARLAGSDDEGGGLDESDRIPALMGLSSGPFSLDGEASGFPGRPSFGGRESFGLRDGYGRDPFPGDALDGFDEDEPSPAAKSEHVEGDLAVKGEEGTNAASPSASPARGPGPEIEPLEVSIEAELGRRPRAGLDDEDDGEAGEELGEHSHSESGSDDDRDADDGGGRAYGGAGRGGHVRRPSSAPPPPRASTPPPPVPPPRSLTPRPVPRGARPPPSVVLPPPPLGRDSPAVPAIFVMHDPACLPAGLPLGVSVMHSPLRPSRGAREALAAAASGPSPMGAGLGGSRPGSAAPSPAPDAQLAQLAAQAAAAGLASAQAALAAGRSASPAPGIDPASTIGFPPGVVLPPLGIPAILPPGVGSPAPAGGRFSPAPPPYLPPYGPPLPTMGFGFPLYPPVGVGAGVPGQPPPLPDAGQTPPANGGGAPGAPAAAAALPPGAPAPPAEAAAGSGSAAGSGDASGGAVGTGPSGEAPASGASDDSSAGRGSAGPDGAPAGAGRSGSAPLPEYAACPPPPGPQFFPPPPGLMPPPGGFPHAPGAILTRGAVSEGESVDVRAWLEDATPRAAPTPRSRR